MGRPKGFVPEPCAECGNRGRHKTTCPRSLKPKGLIAKVVEREHIKNDAVAEGGLAAVHAYVSLKQDYKCTAKVGTSPCGELLEVGRQHWTTGNGDHLCMEHAMAYERRRRAA